MNISSLFSNSLRLLLDENSISRVNGVAWKELKKKKKKRLWLVVSTNGVFSPGLVGIQRQLCQSRSRVVLVAVGVVVVDDNNDFIVVIVNDNVYTVAAVSYTHLTLPTRRTV